MTLVVKETLQLFLEMLVYVNFIRVGYVFCVISIKLIGNYGVVQTFRVTTLLTSYILANWVVTSDLFDYAIESRVV